MPFIDRSSPAPVALVHVDDPRGGWNVPASHVVRIVSATAWRSTPAVDVLALLGPVAATGHTVANTHRVVVVRGTGDREVALLAAGAIAITDVDPSNVLPLPAALSAAAPQVSAIVVAPDAQLSLLLEPEELCPSRS